MGVSVIIWYLATSLYAAVFGCFTALVCNPKLENVSALTGSMMAQAHSMQTEAMGGDSPLLKLIYGLFMNPFQALAEGRFLPVIVFSILLGLAARAMLDSTTDSNTRNAIAAVLRGFEGIQQIIFRIVDWVMRYFPIGIFALTLTCFGSYGVVLLSSYFQIALSVIVGILLMILGCYPLFIFLICRENPYPILWKLREPILTAFVTRSSAAALPCRFCFGPPMRKCMSARNLPDSPFRSARP